MRIKSLYVIAEDERGDEFLLPVTSFDVLKIVRAHLRGKAKQHKPCTKKK